MALNWNWDNKMGTCTVGNVIGTTECNIYDCNGLFVTLYEFNEDGADKYQMVDFALDETHFKNCLGISKGYEDSNKNDVYEYRLNMSYKKANKIAKLLMQAQSKGKWDGTLITYFNK